MLRGRFLHSAAHCVFSMRTEVNHIKAAQKGNRMVPIEWLSQSKCLMGGESRYIPISLQAQQQQNKTQTMTPTTLTVTLHCGWRQTQMDPLSPNCPKQEWFRSKAPFAPCFPQLLPWQQNPTSLCTAPVSAIAVLWLCAGHLLLGLMAPCHTAYASPFCIPPRKTTFLQAGLGSKSGSFKSVKPWPCHPSSKS